MRAKLQVLALTLSAMALGACGPKPVRIALPPADLTSCADEPAAPLLPGRDAQDERDRLTLDYVLSLRSAWGDCKSKTEGLKAWVESVQ